MSGEKKVLGLGTVPFKDLANYRGSEQGGERKKKVKGTLLRQIRAPTWPKEE